MKTVCMQQYTIQDEILSRVSFGETHFGKINISDLDKIQQKITHVHCFWLIKY